MSYANPYQSGYYGGTPPAPGCEEVLTPRMIRVLGETKWWVLVLAIIGTLSTLIRLVDGLLWLGAGPGMMGYVLGSMLGTLLFGVVPVIMLFIYSLSCRDFTLSGHAYDLHKAVRVQKTMWLVFGVLTILWMLLLAVVVISGIKMMNSVQNLDLQAAPVNNVRGIEP